VTKAELETFAGWLDIANGTPEQELRRHPVAATPLLGVILETPARRPPGPASTPPGG
jgi:hypothetical protein